jgi:hypothetical protein
VIALPSVFIKDETLSRLIKQAVEPPSRYPFFPPFTMSILFYRRPDYKSPWSTPLNASDCQRYIERTRGSAHAIPQGLSFDEIISNKPLPVSTSGPVAGGIS